MPASLWIVLELLLYILYFFGCFQLKPIYDFTEQLLVRLEEFQVLLDVVNMNQMFAGNMASFLSFKNEFDSLCNKIDRLEALMLHVQSNLDELEEKIIKKETELGFGESSLKVSSIFTPLFVCPVENFRFHYLFNVF